MKKEKSQKLTKEERAEKRRQENIKKLDKIVSDFVAELMAISGDH